ncbi:FMN-binding negative transcriptional regulator [Mesorhizobium carmichaelinearum]|uniref:FMN-binding negative transcriptional regulator n=1 Tax=Mesorhizobium carmichaelinearum TaxID=1208188 RepID=UPI002452AB41|nr:FMN-binding negative transcriptional regulator [Mesorhizobium carmichaelinearum]
MYVPAHFNEPNRDVLYDMIENNVLGVLITHGASGLDANHIPSSQNARWSASTCQWR